jgi:hypothetical protein
VITLWQIALSCSSRGPAAAAVLSFETAAPAAASVLVPGPHFACVTAATAVLCSLMQALLAHNQVIREAAYSNAGEV